MLKYKKARNAAFTLIELLVVIAIIALLLAILLPSLRKAKDQVRTIICRSNLKQWGVFFYLYTQENEGNFMYGGEPRTEPSWVIRLDCVSLAMPKSEIFGFSSLVRSILAGFKSRCIIP